MNCLSEGELQTFKDKEFPPERQEEITLHLQNCNSCSDILANLSLAQQESFAALDVLILNDLPILIPPFITKEKGISIRRILLTTSAAASILAILGAGIYYVQFQQHRAAKAAENISKARYEFTRNLDANQAFHNNQLIIIETDVNGDVTETYLSD